MDVQALAPTLSSTTFTLPPLPGGSPDAPPPAPASTPAVAPASSGNGNSGASTSGTAVSGPDPGAALLPPAPSGDSKGDLSANIGKVFNAPAESSYQVSFQPAEGSNEIVTVVTDKATGKVVTQFPSETLIALAQFFQKIDNQASSNGAVVDKKV